MADMNTVSLTGRMVRDVEVKTTESGKKVASFSIAVNGFKRTTLILSTVLPGKRQ